MREVRTGTARLALPQRFVTTRATRTLRLHGSTRLRLLHARSRWERTEEVLAGVFAAPATRHRSGLWRHSLTLRSHGLSPSSLFFLRFRRYREQLLLLLLLRLQRFIMFMLRLTFSFRFTSLPTVTFFHGPVRR